MGCLECHQSLSRYQICVTRRAVSPICFGFSAHTRWFLLWRSIMFPSCFPTGTASAEKSGAVSVETQQVRRLFLPLVVAFYIVCIFHSQQTMRFESEAQLRLENDVSMPSRHQMGISERFQRMHRPRLILLKRDLLVRRQVSDARSLEER